MDVCDVVVAAAAAARDVDWFHRRQCAAVRRS